MENPPFWWYLPGKMGIFMGYVSFREGSLVWLRELQVGHCHSAGLDPPNAPFFWKWTFGLTQRWEPWNPHGFSRLKCLNLMLRYHTVTYFSGIVWGLVVFRHSQEKMTKALWVFELFWSNCSWLCSMYGVMMSDVTWGSSLKWVVEYEGKPLYFRQFFPAGEIS